MPRNVRNFWLELSVDGATKRIETGPRKADGGFDLTILQRDNGGIVRAMEISGRIRDGRIVLEATAKPGTMGELDQTITFETKR